MDWLCVEHGDKTEKLGDHLSSRSFPVTVVARVGSEQEETGENTPGEKYEDVGELEESEIKELVVSERGRVNIEPSTGLTEESLSGVG